MPDYKQVNDLLEQLGQLRNESGEAKMEPDLHPGFDQAKAQARMEALSAMITNMSPPQQPYPAGHQSEMYIPNQAGENIGGMFKADQDTSRVPKPETPAQAMLQTPVQQKLESSEEKLRNFLNLKTR